MLNKLRLTRDIPKIYLNSTVFVDSEDTISIEDHSHFREENIIQAILRGKQMLKDDEQLFVYYNAKFLQRHSDDVLSSAKIHAQYVFSPDLKCNTVLIATDAIMANIKLDKTMNYLAKRF